jgi:hypothetical protein
VLLPTTFPNGAASQEASAALADTRRELAETFDGCRHWSHSRTRPVVGVLSNWKQMRSINGRRLSGIAARS